MREQYLRAGEGFIICFSLIDRTSFDCVPGIIQEIQKIQQENKVPIVLVGTKCDLEDERKVSNQEIIKLCNDYFSINYFETSSKNSIKVNDTFLQICREILKKRNEKKISEKKDNKDKCIIS
jgi:GTPase SAR1 family protein